MLLAVLISGSPGKTLLSSRLFKLSEEELKSNISRNVAGKYFLKCDMKVLIKTLSNKSLSMVDRVMNDLYFHLFYIFKNV